MKRMLLFLLMTLLCFTFSCQKKQYAVVQSNNQNMSLNASPKPEEPVIKTVEIANLTSLSIDNQSFSTPKILTQNISSVVPFVEKFKDRKTVFRQYKSLFLANKILKKVDKENLYSRKQHKTIKRWE